MTPTSTREPKIRRVIISDPSLRDFVGHHYAYDTSILDALDAQGIAGEVLAHRDAPRFLPADARIDPVYTEDMWRNLRAPAHRRTEARVLRLRAAGLLLAPLFATHAVLARLRVRARRPGEGVPDRRPEGARSAAAPSLKDALRARAARVPRAWRLWVTLRECLHLARGTKEVAGYLLDHAPLPGWLPRLALRNPRFYVETREALRRRALGRGDLVFAHMLVHSHLLEWAAIALDEAQRKGAQIVLLLRYPPGFYRPGALKTRLAWRALERAWSAGHLRLATDSERLARAFAEHTYIPIEVFPIPHVATHPHRGASAPGAALRAASLGNARSEKGILDIARAIELLHETGDAAGFEFILQVNDPDSGCRDALARFRARELPGIRFLDRALDGPAYEETLAAADVVLVPYWREIYVARTSGVFVEALAAGKIVVATADTWMSDELARCGGGVLVPCHSPQRLAEALRALRRGHETLAAQARAAAHSARAFHSPRRFVAALCAAPDNFPQERRAAVIYPWNNFLTRASGASLRTGLLMDVIEEHGYALSLLLGSDNETVAPPARHRVIPFVSEPLRGNLLMHLYTLGLRIASLGRSRPGDGVLYLYKCWYRRRRYRIALNRALRGCRVAFLEYTALFDVVAPLARAQGIRLVVSEHDVLAEQAGYAPIRAAILAAEIAALRQADLAVSVSEADRATFAARGAQTVLVPNSVAVTGRKVYDEGEARASLARLGIAPPARYVVFVGSHHGPNLVAAEFLRALGARFAAEQRGLAVVVIGACHAPLSAPGFVALGMVGDEARDALYGAAAAVVVPLREGTGSSLKTVEAMAAGKAVIGTSVAFRGLAVKDGLDAIVEDDLARYTQRLPELLRDPDLLAAIGRRAREFALTCDYRAMYRPYLDFLAGLDGAPTAAACENPGHSPAA